MLEREFYYLDDLATRWQCSVDDLLHLGLLGELLICANTAGLETDTTLVWRYKDGGCTQHVGSLFDSVFIDIAELDRWEARIHRPMPVGMVGVFYRFLRLFEKSKDGEVELSRVLFLISNIWKCHRLSPPFRVKHTDLCVLSDEVRRLDAERFAKAPTIPADPPPLSERQETTYLNIIGGLLSLLLETPSPTRRLSFGNQAAVIQTLLERFPHVQGLKERTLQDKFAKAKQSLNQ